VGLGDYILSGQSISFVEASLTDLGISILSVSSDFEVIRKLRTHPLPLVFPTH
jgi:hypothetical protein